jgi:hypothetical protein
VELATSLYLDLGSECEGLHLHATHVLSVEHNKERTLQPLHFGFDILTAVKMVSWVVTPYRLVKVDTNVSEKHTVSIFRA